MTDWPPIAPLPAEPLGYSTANSGKPPGVVTAIGVISIVIGSIGILAAGGAGLFAVVMMAMSRASASMVASQNASAAAVTANTMEVVPMDGLRKAQRQIIVDALSDVRPLNARRKRQLDALLLESGQKVFALSDDAITPDVIRHNVSKSSTMSAEGNPDAQTRFVLGIGTLTVSDSEATFEPTDGGTLSAKVDLAATQPALAQAVMDRIAALTSHKLNKAQQQALTNALNAPGQTILSSASPTVVSEIQNASAQQNGTVTFFTNTSVVQLPPTGGITISPFGVGSNPFMKITGGIAAGAFADAALSMLLAVYLLVAGIFAIRQSRHGRVLHWVYIALKVPLVVFGIWIWTTLLNQMTSGFGGGAGGSIKTTFWLATGLLYPVVLVILMQTKAARDYYQARLA